MGKGKFFDEYILGNSSLYGGKDIYMRILSIFLVLIYVQLSYANDQKLKICLAGSTEKTIPNYGEAFVNGARLAINELPSKVQEKIELEVHYYDVTALAALNELQIMRKAGCDAILGFSTGNDLLAIEDDLALNPILTLSIYGDPQDRFEKTNYLRTIQPNAEMLLGHLFEKIPYKMKREDRVLVITASDRSEMLEYKKAIEPLLKNRTNNVTYLNVIEQTHDISEFLKVHKEIKNWDYVILLTRSLIAAKITDELSESKTQKMPILIGTKYFGSSELPAYLNFLKNKDIEAYFSRQNCSCDNSKSFLAFSIKYEKQFKKKPMLISVDTYDSVRFLSSIVGQVEKIDSATIIDYFSKTTNQFIGAGTLVVNPRFKVVSEKKFLIRVSKNGYESMK